MNLCDSNVWLALSLSGHVHHERVRAWFENVQKPASLHFCRATQQTLLRLLTNDAVLAPYRNRALSNAEAWDAYQSLISDDRIAYHRTEPPELERLWIDFARRDTASPKLWMDAYLAAYALAAGQYPDHHRHGIQTVPEPQRHGAFVAVGNNSGSTHEDSINRPELGSNL